MTMADVDAELARLGIDMAPGLERVRAALSRAKETKPGPCVA